ncbi:MAG: NAD(P)H-dependent oxidoreductase subunit E [Bacteroidales bacterium]|nr:NAD(P)H-dependent oxidoreductase subunit E [Bacteroidales bacterium]MDY0217479.1 NAD(P)H-dependent oxidoreductase subunit E [Bacteroidales bacterium]
MVEVENLVKRLVNIYGKKRESLLPVLQGIVEQERTLTEVTLKIVAQELDLSAAQVYGTATFYSFLDTEPRGEFVIRVCKSITCAMKGKNQMIKTIEDTLKLKLGETTKDKKFTLLQTNCLGWCHKAPAMLINDEVYIDLDLEKVMEIIQSYSRKGTY